VFVGRTGAAGPYPQHAFLCTCAISQGGWCDRSAYAQIDGVLLLNKMFGSWCLAVRATLKICSGMQHAWWDEHGAKRKCRNAAQLGFLASLIGEKVTGFGPLKQFGLETGIPLGQVGGRICVVAICISVTMCCLGFWWAGRCLLATCIDTLPSMDG